MKAGELKIQLVGYAIDEEGTIVEIAKSPVIKAIVGNSVNGIITEGDADPSMIEILKAKLDKLLEEGINVEGGGGIDTVDTVNDLPADAEKDDIAFVKTEELIETVNSFEKVKVKVTGMADDTINLEIDPDAIFISDVWLEEKYPEFAGNSIWFGAEMETLSGELELQIRHQTPSSVYQQLGLNQGIDFYQINQYGGDSMAVWIKLRGMSIKDFLT